MLDAGVTLLKRTCSLTRNKYLTCSRIKIGTADLASQPLPTGGSKRNDESLQQGTEEFGAPPPPSAPACRQREGEYRARREYISFRSRRSTPRIMNHKDVRSKYSISKQNQPDWCHFCKCWVQTNANAKRMHEQSNQHKKAVEIKMREIRKTKQKEEREEEATKRALANIEAKAAQAYQADLAGGARPEDTHGPKPLSAEARHRLEQEGVKRELEEAVAKELKARAEAQYRTQQELGEWKFDDRSSYYWHAKSSCYFDPKTKMFFNTKSNAWSKDGPENAPPLPGTESKADAPTASGAEPGPEEQYPLGPFSSKAAESTPAAPAASSKQAAIPAAQVNKVAGWTHAPTGMHTSSRVASSTKPTTKPAGKTSMFNLGYGTNHPAYEAAKARTHSSAQRAMESAGGRTFQAADIKQLGVVGKDGGAVKRKREEGKPSGKQPKVSKEEAEAQAKRAAARARVEARTMKSFGLQ